MHPRNATTACDDSIDTLNVYFCNLVIESGQPTTWDCGTSLPGERVTFTWSSFTDRQLQNDDPTINPEYTIIPFAPLRPVFVRNVDIETRRNEEVYPIALCIGLAIFSYSHGYWSSKSNESAEYMDEVQAAKRTDRRYRGVEVRCGVNADGPRKCMTVVSRTIVIVARKYRWADSGPSPCIACSVVAGQPSFPGS
jgi:hypothetical protein